MTIEIPDSKAGELFRKFGFGIMSEGKIIFHPLEIAYLLEKGKIDSSGETASSILQKLKSEDPLAEEKYAVLKELRINGYIAKPSFAKEEWMRVYRKGFRPAEDRTQFLIRVLEKGVKLDYDSIQADMRKAAEVRKELVYCVVENNKPEFFRLSRTSFD